MRTAGPVPLSRQRLAIPTLQENDRIVFLVCQPRCVLADRGRQVVVAGGIGMWAALNWDIVQQFGLVWG